MTFIVYALIVLSMLVVLVTLGVGLAGFTRGGDFNSRWGNKLMAWRVKTQAVAIAVLLIGCWWVGAHRG